MFKHLLTLSFCALLVVSCSSKKKADDPGIVGKSMSFDPTGSDSGQIAGLNTVNFGYDQATLSADARKQLNGNAEWIKTNKGVDIQIEGHCDERGSVEYNLALGERRAKSVKSYLVSLGVDANRLRVVSYGKEKPLVAGDTEEAYAKNRRANFVPIGK